MKQNEAINIIRAAIPNIESLTREDKFKLDLILDKASRSLESYDTGTLIVVLEDLIRYLKNNSEASQGYIDALYIVLDKLKLEKRKTDILDNNFFPAFDDFRPITLGNILSSFCTIEKDGDKIILTPVDKNLLDRIVKIYHDDGMGYSPEGSNPVFTAYQEDQNGDISMWI